MKLSARACHGTRALIELAKHWRQGPTLLKDIARKENVSLPYLARLMAPLIAAGLVGSTRGVHGGVWLVKPPGEIGLGELVRLLDGPIAPMECVSNPDSCENAGTCAPRGVWLEVEKAVLETLNATTLADLVSQQEQLERATEVMYYI